MNTKYGNGTEKGLMAMCAILWRIGLLSKIGILGCHKWLWIF
jgi:hypothetical protein